jgi:hypothetical protein
MLHSVWAPPSHTSIRSAVAIDDASHGAAGDAAYPSILAPVSLLHVDTAPDYAPLLHSSYTSLGVAPTDWLSVAPAWVNTVHMETASAGWAWRNWPRAPWEIRWADGTAVRGAPPLRQEVVRPQRTIRKRTIREGGYSFLPTFNIYRTGGLAASPESCHIIAGRGQKTYGDGRSTLRLLLLTYGSREGVESMVGLAAPLQAPGAEIWYALVATSMMLAGGWL